MAEQPKATETPNPDPAAPAAAAQPVVPLEQLASVLDKLDKRLEQLESRPQKPGTDPLQDPYEYLEQIEREAETRTPVKQPQEVDLSQLDTNQMVQYVMGQVGSQFIQPLVNRIETIRVKMEVAEVASKNPDFWDYRAEVLQIGTKNPTLSVQEAYDLAKSRSPKKKEATPPSVPAGDKKRAIPLEQLARSSGERPGQASTAAVAPPKGLGGAASKAWDDIMEGGE